MCSTLLLIFAFLTFTLFSPLSFSCQPRPSQVVHSLCTPRAYVNANDIHQFMPKSNLAISTSLPPTKCKSLELRSNCTSDCILDNGWDIKPTTISFVTLSFLPFVLCPYRHRQLRCHNITCIPVSCCVQNNWRCQNH